MTNQIWIYYGKIENLVKEEVQNKSGNEQPEDYCC